MSSHGMQRVFLPRWYTTVQQSLSAWCVSATYDTLPVVCTSQAARAQNSNARIIVVLSLFLFSAFESVLLCCGLPSRSVIAFLH
eukprot:3455-Heterococcus_DN1.PRE.3